MLYIALIDDEPLARSRLRRHLEAMSEVELVGEGGTGEDAIRLCQELRPDVLLLDIRMPGMTGLDAAKEIRQLDSPPVIIFCTAFDEHALSAFETDALDYLVKPVRFERLEQALGKARKYLNKSEAEEDGRKYLQSRVGDRVELVPIEGVIFFLSDNKYTTVCHEGGAVLIDDTLKSLEDEFGDRFFRVHRNALVCRSRIRGLTKDREGHPRLLVEGSDQELEVSRRNLPAVRKLIRQL